MKLLGTEGAEDTDWYDAAENIAREAKRLGGALFCLNDWPEPEDQHPDSDRQSPMNLRIRVALNGLFPVCGRSGDMGDPE